MPYINWRNEAVRFERLLVSACKTLEAYYPDAMPQDVARYWNAKKTLALMRKEKTSEFGVLQTLLADEEQRIEDLLNGD